MSTFTNYNVVSNNYDGRRSAIGIDLYAGLIMAITGKPLSEVHVLDAGCGTGNFSRALLERGVGRVTMIDASEGMLSQARPKVMPYTDQGRVIEMRLHQLPNLPFEDNQFDVIMFNHVLHHLDADMADSAAEKGASDRNNAKTEDPVSTDKNVNRYPLAYKAVVEAARVLKTKGVLFVLTCEKHQITEALWYYKLMPDVNQRYSRRWPPTRLFESAMLEGGVSHVDIYSLVSALETVWDEYANLDGPFSPEWRNGDSFYSYATEAELDNCLALIERMKHEGTLRDFFLTCDEKRREIGTSTVIVGVKNPK